MSTHKSDVVIVGGGIAGLAAAAVLAGAGRQVTLLEAGGDVGGKLEDGHGMHGWWPSYLNFFALLDHVGLDLDAVLGPKATPAFVYPDGSYSILDADAGGIRGRLDMAVAALRGDHLSVVDLLLAAKAMALLPGYRHDRDFERFDDVSMHAALANGGATVALMESLLEPLVHNFFFTGSERVSAAAAFSGMGVYLFGTVDDLRPRYCLGEAKDLIIDPIRAYITAHGGQVLTASPAQSLHIEGGRVIGVRVGGGQPHAVKIEDIPATEPLLVTISKKDGFLVRRKPDDAGFVVLDRLCTHMGMALVERDGDGLRCDVHNCRFDLDGNTDQPRCKGPLSPRRAEVKGDQLLVAPRAEAREYQAPHVVLAVGPVGAAQLIEATPAAWAEPSLRGISSVGGTSSAVVRLWLDQPWRDEPTNGVFAQPGLVDNFFVLSEHRADHKGPAAKAVVEVHCYMVDGLNGVPRSDRRAWLLDQVVSELSTRLPRTFDKAQVLRSEVRTHPSTFATFKPGSASRRPRTRGPWPNLFFAGDWVRVDQPWWWMERSVATGIMAATAVLEAQHVPVPLRVTTPRPPAMWRRIIRVPVAARYACRGLVERLVGVRWLKP